MRTSERSTIRGLQGSPSHVFAQEGKDVALPNANAQVEEVVPIIRRVPDGRIDLQSMWLADTLAAGVQHLAGRQRVIVLGVNEEDRRRDVVDGGEEPRSQLGRIVSELTTILPLSSEHVSRFQ